MFQILRADDSAPLLALVVGRIRCTRAGCFYLSSCRAIEQRPHCAVSSTIAQDREHSSRQKHPIDERKRRCVACSVYA